MIKTLQRKFIVTAMIAVSMLLLALLGAINIFSAVSSAADSQRLLGQLASFEDFGPAIRPELREDQEKGVFRRSPDENDRMSALTFSVRFDGEDQLRSLSLDRIATVDETQAEALGRQALESGRTEGRLENYRYRIVQPAPDSRTVVFLDVSGQQRSLLRLAVLSLLGGALAWLAMLLLVSLLSRRAIRPIAENMQRQRQFVTDAGHELKTPLAIILANTEALELQQGESKYSKNIREQVRRLTGLTQNLLTLARADEASAPSSDSIVDLSGLCSDQVEMFRAPAELRGLGLEAQIAPEVSVRGDGGQLGQLLSILLDNAVKYCSEGGGIALELSGGDRPLLRLSNSVSGEEIDTERIFDRFYRRDESRSRQTGGFGIGLSAARAIARAHGAELTAECAEGRICFSLRFPIRK